MGTYKYSDLFGMARCGTFWDVQKVEATSGRWMCMGGVWDRVGAGTDLGRAVSETNNGEVSSRRLSVVFYLSRGGGYMPQLALMY